MKKYTLLLSTLLLASGISARESINLSGKWAFGFGDTPIYNDTISLPGSMLTNGKGNDVDANTKWTGSLYDMSYYYREDMAPYREKGNIKFPFFLTPDKEYVGNAYYKRNVDVPANWKGKRVILHLERPHIETTPYVNGNKVGHQMSLSTPHEYDVTDYIIPGSRNEIALTVYNGIENVCVGQDSHSVTDQTQGNWNGVVGNLTLYTTPKNNSIKSVRVYPNVSAKKALVNVILTGKKGNLSKSTAIATDNDNMSVIKASNPKISGDTLTFTLNMGDKMRLWDEFNPVTYSLNVTVGNDTLETTFGMRDFSIQGHNFLINGRPAYIRGTVGNCCFPLTGYPPTDEASWRAIFEKCKEYGINMMRFHSYCPPEAAFSAADKVGIYLQPEGPSWPNHGVKLNAGMDIDSYLLEESKRIVDSYGNHPSFVMMAAGNEPAGNWVPYCNYWVNEMKKYDATKVYCGASVGGGWAWDDGSEYHVKGGARGLTWHKSQPSSNDDFADEMKLPRNFKPTAEKPVNTEPILSHEQGQWCAFPDFKEISQYTGAYKAKNFEIFRNLLCNNGMKEMAEKFLMSSGKLQTLCYKYEIERNLRTPNYSGFQLLALNDYSGQGTALEGVLNVFWKEKGYVTAPEWREFCNDIVPLARFPKFVFSNTDSFAVPIEVMNASASSITDATLKYTITDNDGKTYTQGEWSIGDVNVGKNHQCGTISLHLDNIDTPTKLTLTAMIPNQAKNHWEFWVYPEEKISFPDNDIYFTDSLNSKAIEILRNGGKVLIAAAGKVTLGSDVVQHYLPVFWNTSWFKMRPPHTTGAYIDTTHPLFSHNFPTDDWSNLNWWELLNRAQVMNLMELPADYQSPIQPIDTWHISRKLGMLIEANVLNGKLLMTTMNIADNLDKRIVGRRMRNAILDYMKSDEFNPALNLDVETVSNFFTKQTPPIKMYTNDSPDELKPKLM